MSRWYVTLLLIHGVACAPGGGTTDAVAIATDSGVTAPDSTPASSDAAIIGACDPTNWDDSMGVCGQFHVRTWLPPPETFPPINALPSPAPLPGATIEIRDMANPDVITTSAIAELEGISSFIFSLPFDIYACVRDIDRIETCTHYFGAGVLAAFSDILYSVSAADFALLHSLAGMPEDPTTGVFMGNVGGIDSPTRTNGNMGYSVTTDTGGIVVYRVNGMPDPTATETDDFGDFDIFGVPPGSVVVTATDGTETIVRNVYCFAGSVHTVMYPR